MGRQEVRQVAGEWWQWRWMGAEEMAVVGGGSGGGGGGGRWVGAKWHVCGSAGPAPVPWGWGNRNMEPGLVGAEGPPGSIMWGLHAGPGFSA